MARLGSLMGLELMPWQRYVADVALEVDPVTGWWVFDEVVVTVPRRGGKSALTMTVKVHRLATVQRAKLWMSAQSGVKALERWNDLKTLLETSPLKAKMRGYTSIGHERIVWHATGSKLVPIAPDGGLLHGEEADLVDLDEIWSYDAEQALTMQGGYRPTFLTTNGQAWLYSTAGTPASAWLNQLRRAGRAGVERGRRSGTAYFEWSMPEVDADDRPWDEWSDGEIIAAALDAHPAIGQHPRVPAQRMRDIITADFEALGRAEFVRAYGNLTSADDAGRLFPDSLLRTLIDGEPIPADALVELGLDVHPDRADAALYAGWRSPDGRVRVEQIAYGPGTRWAAGRAIANARAFDTRVAVINVGAARDVADDIERVLGPDKLLRVSQPDWAAACTRVHDEMTAAAPTMVIRGELELLEAFAHVGWRNAGQGRAFTSVDGGSITAATGSTLAVWAADHPAERPVPLGRFKIR